MLGASPDDFSFEKSFLSFEKNQIIEIYSTGKRMANSI